MNNAYSGSAIVVQCNQISYNNLNKEGKFETLNSDTWLVDTGASSLIANSLKYFSNISPVDNWYVLLPNNLRLKATHKGSIKFAKDFVLFDVFFVPDFKYNLLSVTKLVASIHCE